MTWYLMVNNSIVVLVSDVKFVAATVFGWPWISNSTFRWLCGKFVPVLVLVLMVN
jgi:hypothetical protein